MNDDWIGKRVEVSMADGFGLGSGIYIKDGNVYKIKLDAINSKRYADSDGCYTVQKGDDVSLSTIQFDSSGNVENEENLPDIFKAFLK